MRHTVHLNLRAIHLKEELRIPLREALEAYADEWIDRNVAGWHPGDPLPATDLTMTEDDWTTE